MKGIARCRSRRALPRTRNSASSSTTLGRHFSTAVENFISAKDGSMLSPCTVESRTLVGFVFHVLKLHDALRILQSAAAFAFTLNSHNLKMLMAGAPQVDALNRRTNISLRPSRVGEHMPVLRVSSAAAAQLPSKRRQRSVGVIGQELRDITFPSFSASILATMTSSNQCPSLFAMGTWLTFGNAEYARF